MSLILLQISLFSNIYIQSTSATYDLFRWTDINTQKIIRWENDTKIIDPNIKPVDLKISIYTNPTDLKHCESSFGIPLEMLNNINENSKKLMSQKIYELEKYASSRGIKISKSKNNITISPDYIWMIDQSIASVQKYARKIIKAAKEKGYKTNIDLVGSIASFCQSITYKIPKKNKVVDKKIIRTGGVMMPLEVLAKRYGDCDSKSVLFASLVRSVNLGDVIFLTHPSITIDSQGHLFVGINIKGYSENPKKDHIFWKDPLDSKKYLLLELTAPWPMGKLPSDLENKVRKSKLIPIRLQRIKKDS